MVFRSGTVSTVTVTRLPDWYFRCLNLVFIKIQGFSPLLQGEGRLAGDVGRRVSHLELFALEFVKVRRVVGRHAFSLHSLYR